MEKMVTIDILQKSQRTRPRHWIPVFSAILLVLNLVMIAFYGVLAFTQGSMYDLIVKSLPQQDIVYGGNTFTFANATILFFAPLAILVLSLIDLIFCIVICRFRHVYFWLGIPALIGFIAIELTFDFYLMYYALPFIRDLLANAPPVVLDILMKVHMYGNLAVPVLFALFWILCLFYNINYPARYEEIYRLRKERLKAYKNLDDRIAYKKRFYRDYALGHWISMMLDLHFASLDKNSTKRMRKDAYDFVVYYSCLCDTDVKKAVLDQYAAEGRYYEIRSIFHGIKDKAESVRHGAKVVLPHYEPLPTKKRHIVKAEEPQPAVPALVPTPVRHPADPAFKKWSPDDIG